MRLLAAEPRRTFIPLSVSLSNDLGDPVFDGVGLSVFQSKANTFSMALLLTHFCLLLFSLSLVSFNGLVLRACGLRTDRVKIALSQSCTANIFNNNNRRN